MKKTEVENNEKFMQEIEKLKLALEEEREETEKNVSTVDENLSE